ncbi:uncharacterized protein LOC113513905 [Galleria mellonella]|uniref:Uncharacterized protein LOC113513905 n=1 Tax=Galleria mellonella TaxID=7137 RepID=A0ABM3N221_GALME|nr:uncharacterized protein LOC113513905 [Galleria mellonella]
MDYDNEKLAATVLHWNYRGFTEFPLQQLRGEESDVTDIYLKDNLISRLPTEIYRLQNLESLYLSGNDITELPREISMLRCLKCLDLSGNRLKHIPDEIGDVRNLKFLILDENELIELPLRLAELRALQYLSVCDNKLQWLPQKPVFNYHHCEFRFWRNIYLKSIPYALWYHMFRGQQTRSLNIGCLKIPTCDSISENSRCQLRLYQDSRQWELYVDSPQYNVVLKSKAHSPPSLLEICKRLLYEIISDTAKKKTKLAEENINNLSGRLHYYYNLDYIENNFEEFNIKNDDVNKDINSNNPSYLLKERHVFNRSKGNMKDYYVPKDIVEDFLNFLPKFIKIELINGPISRCEYISCKRPVFDYVYYEFCFGKIILIDNTEDIILSAAFCSKSCADTWKIGKVGLIPWSLLRKKS